MGREQVWALSRGGREDSELERGQRVCLWRMLSTGRSGRLGRRSGTRGEERLGRGKQLRQTLSAKQ